MVQEVLVALSFIVVIASIITIIARAIKQPPIIAYLICGVIVGPLVLNLVGLGSSSEGLLQTFSRIGVAFLLFIVGLSLDFRLLKEIGTVSSLAGIIQVSIVSFLGYFICIAMGFNSITALYIGIALAFSSTVVVVKILSDKKEIDTLHGRIAIGILIIQDIIAALALMIFPILNGDQNVQVIITDIGLAIGMIIFVFIIAKFAFGKFMNYLAKSQETLFLFGIAWALALATIFYKLGFSMEIGALIAGISLASGKYALDLEGKMMPLRDFFIVLFFVFFGSQLTSLNSDIVFKAIILSLFVMLIKPITVMTILKFFGYTKRTNFLTSVSLAQVSEFSLILVMVGFSLGQLNQEIMNLSVLVALFTIGISTYAINHAHWINEKLSGVLSLFEGHVLKEKEKKIKEFEIVLIGYHRIGYKILETIRKLSNKFVVIDYNPKVVLDLNKKKIESIYGDAGNKNFLEEIGLNKAKIVISTIPDEHTNLTIIETLKEINSKAIFIGTAEQPRTALDLYKAGADYVIIPHHLGGDFASHLIKSFGVNKEKYKSIGREHRHHIESSKNNSTFS